MEPKRAVLCNILFAAKLCVRIFYSSYDTTILNYVPPNKIWLYGCSSRWTQFSIGGYTMCGQDLLALIHAIRSNSCLLSRLHDGSSNIFSRSFYSVQTTMNYCCNCNFYIFFLNPTLITPEYIRGLSEVFVLDSQIN